jgi:hypothetical protein
MTDLPDHLLEKYIIQEGHEQAVNRRLRYVGLYPSVVLGGVASVTTWWLLAFYVPLLALNAWLVHAMYERDWGIYQNSIARWGKKGEYKFKTE